HGERGGVPHHRRYPVHRRAAAAHARNRHERDRRQFEKRHPASAGGRRFQCASHNRSSSIASRCRASTSPDLQGKLIVIEGPDAAGRSTQIAQLRQWLEQEGHAVLDTGMARSALAGKGISRAKEGNTLGPIAMTLYYVTDFAD